MSSSPKDIEEIFSDESSFYGDEDEQARLEEQAAAYDPEPFWSEVHPHLLSTVQYNLHAPPATSKPISSADQDAKPSSTTLPENSRGDKETTAQFLSRLPPSTTSFSTIGPWIWMHSPQAPPMDEGDVPALMRKGTELLHSFEDESSRLRAAHEKSGAKTTAALTRKLNPLRRELEQNLFAAAREARVTAGKWMLFPTVDRADAVWAAVVKALEKGELGDVAKVATDDGSGHARLICVYTNDFEDMEDVKRVLRGLVDAGLVEEQARPIYYKCDAYTHLDIKSSNDYGLKASMFSSRDVLAGKV
ncbi:hypothetical protein NUU61_000780 [Penicillium alfredii]|uniref:DUF1917-domain-containing protein n=1 Tax=Penicillium alfredii TaxID=1506179 RepID=A0A9W9KRC6_9EURO|nr:uncharacterized protein NUU61_000780 [Penicillium alfredii]KAJ5115021.1 hypothetical protein NUU61_000780 [Penicillium alfredii]